MSLIDRLHQTLAERLRKLYVNVLLFYAGAALHLYWGASLLVDPQKTRTSGLASILVLCGDSSKLAGLLLFGIAVVSFYAILNNGKFRSFMMLLPQQILLTISALSVLQCVIHGQFADGVARSGMFILRDQAPLVLIALMHSISMFGFGLYLMIKARCSSSAFLKSF